MWCLTFGNGTRSFHPTKDAADAAGAGNSEHVVWFDSFDYETHNPGELLTWLRITTDAERAIGRAYVAARLEELRSRWIDSWRVEAAS